MTSRFLINSAPICIHHSWMKSNWNYEDDLLQNFLLMIFSKCPVHHHHMKREKWLSIIDIIRFSLVKPGKSFVQSHDKYFSNLVSCICPDRLSVFHHHDMKLRVFNFLPCLSLEATVNNWHYRVWFAKSLVKVLNNQRISCIPKNALHHSKTGSAIHPFHHHL